MKLRVWIAEQKNDARCYNIIARTKKDCLKQVSEAWNSNEYQYMVQQEIEYKDAYDLFDILTAEGGGRGPYDQHRISDYIIQVIDRKQIVTKIDGNDYWVDAKRGKENYLS